MNIIEDLCKKLTDLNDEEIEIICGMSNNLKPLANLEDADIFIDCLALDGNAIVVAEAKPDRVPSSYKKTVVGLLAKPENEPAVARTFRLGVATKQMKAITQESTVVVQSVEPIMHNDRVIGVLICEKKQDTTTANTQQLHFSTKSYETIANAISHMVEQNSWLTECIDEGLVLVDNNGIVAFRNSLAHNMYQNLGFVHDILNQPYEDIRLINTKFDEYDKYTVIETQVGEHHLSIKAVILNTKEMAFAIIMRDVTLRHEQEKELILKSVAIKEMHHRVKNNLQTIASLLRLQVRRTDNEETTQVLVESMNRILSIATTHELLARSGVDMVNIGEVINNIKNTTIRSSTRPSFNITSTIEGDDFKVSSDTATSVALIINELLQNSLKYAFPQSDTGNVRIIIERGELYSQIEIIDNGCGFDIQNEKGDRLGLSIVEALVKDKLRGTFEMYSDENGTRVKFDFKNKIFNSIDVT